MALIKVLKIEGVFSGTMSYIFNNFSTASSGGPSFSSVVKIARDNGYTVGKFTIVFLSQIPS